jgi:hypothetical protein
MERVDSAAWRKSTYSGGNGGNCVEVGTASGVVVRDTKNNGSGPVLDFPADAWTAFLGLLR